MLGDRCYHGSAYRPGFTHLLPVAAAVFLATWATGAFYPERRSHFLWRSTSKGEQHQPSFRAVNPNARDRRRRRPGRQRGAGFQLERHQTGRFLGQPADRGELLSWLFFLGTGLEPFSGQAVHFQFAAPDGLDYAVNRYRREAERYNRVLDSQLAGRDYIVGSDYTIVDMSAWGWIDRASRVMKGADDPWRRFQTSSGGSPVELEGKRAGDAISFNGRELVIERVA